MRSSLLFAVAPLAALSACSADFQEAGEIGGAFLEAEAQTGVPAELLIAVAQVETRLQPALGETEFDGVEPAWGVMALRGDNLSRGAALAGVSEQRAREEFGPNVLAAGALMAAWGEAGGIDTNDLGAWAPVVAAYSGITDEEAVREYVWFEVYETLAEGVEVEGFSSEPRLSEPRYPRPSRTRQRTGDSSAVWTASPNYSSRSGYDVEYIVIHSCEGSYSGCWSWLSDSRAAASAHYVVNDTGSEVRQLVDEDQKAWHVAADYDCGNNDGVGCENNGLGTNYISVGIEHAGYSSQTSWNAGLIARSAELACGVATRHGVPIDANHIVSHAQLQPWDRTDPGAAWPWTNYIDAVAAACGKSSSSSSSSSSSTSSSSGSSSTAKQFVIDSNNAANDASAYGFTVSSKWWSSTSISGYWNTGYWAAPTESVSDPASFWFETDASRCYSVEAWWTSGSNRPSAITFVGWDESSREMGRATVDQTKNGGKWNSLGKWIFPAGRNQVLLSRWAASGKYAIADAVRLTPC
jgi:N-acetyl-anhydromuramyl-L-alanine amidase AmpD